MVTVVDVVVVDMEEVAVAASVTSVTDLDILPESAGRKKIAVTNVMVCHYYITNLTCLAFTKFNIYVVVRSACNMHVPLLTTS